MANQLVSIVAVAGWLILALSAYRSRRISGKTTLTYVLVWAAVFLVVALMFGVVGS